MEGENNGQSNRVKRDSGGKNVLLRRAPCQEGHSTTVAMLTIKDVEAQGGRLNCARSTGASNPDDIASRYITRGFMVYYRTV